MTEAVPGTADTARVPVAAHDSPRATLWLPLLRRLTAEVPGWLVIKNAEAALDGVGDIDSMAPAAAWPEIERIFRGWADDRKLTVLGVCRHIWRGPNLVARDPDSPYLLVLDVKTLRTFRGSPLITVGDAQAVATMDPAGFRRIQAGAEGVLKLLHNGTTPLGAANPHGLHSKHVLGLLRTDPVGADIAADWVGATAPALRRVIRAAVAGEWSRADMLVVEAWCLARGLAHPIDPARQLWLRAAGERCPFVRLTRHHRRRLPEDGDAWIESMRRTHRGSSFLAASDSIP